MPGFDRKGPEEKGPMTGRRRGKCTGYGRKLKNEGSCENGGSENDSQAGRSGSGGGTGRQGNGSGRGKGSGRGQGKGKGNGRR